MGAVEGLFRLWDRTAGGWARKLVGTAALLAGFGVVSCGPVPQNAQHNEDAAATATAESEPNPVRHDLEPLTKRFPALGTPVAASWISGEMGDPRVPGPSTYRLDSIIELTPETVATLVEEYRPVPTTEQPDVWPTLTDALPGSSYLPSDALDGAFSSARLSARAFLAADAPVVVITAMGQ
ncbi:hypothetical protein [Mycolicibacterium thermoresistibile]